MSKKNSIVTLPPPGPKGHPILGHLMGRRNDPLGLFVRGAREFGDMVRFRMGPYKANLLVHPEHARRVFIENHNSYAKGRIYDITRMFLGNGILTSEGEYWRRQRKLAQPAFHQKSLESLHSKMVAATNRLMARWDRSTENSCPRDIYQEMNQLTVGIAASTLFGASISESDTEAVISSFGRILELANEKALEFIPLPLSIPTRTSLNIKRVIRALDGIIYRMIRVRAGSKGEHDDVLGLFMSARDEETGKGMSEREARDEVMSFFIAGSETSANTLSWVWYVLSKHPHVYRKLREELDRELGDDSPRFGDLSRLKYTHAIIKETMRIYPPVWAIGRDVVSDDEIGGYRIAKGEFVVLCPYLTHRDPRWWMNPEGFDPDRFMPELSSGTGPQRPRFAYFPFGGGQHQCIGERYAMMEFVTVIAMVARRFRLDLDPLQEIKALPLLTLRPWPGVRMKLVRLG